MIDVQKKIGGVLLDRVRMDRTDFDAIASKTVYRRVSELYEEMYVALNLRLLMDLRPSIRKPVVVHKRLGRILRAHVGFMVEDGDIKVSGGLDDMLYVRLQIEANRSYLNALRAINDNISAP